MFNWRFEEDTEPEKQPETSGDTRPKRRLLLLSIAVTLVVIFAGYGVLRWRVSQREQALRSDLITFIQFEEQVRRSGSRVNAQDLIAGEAPDAWRARYFDSFNSGLPATPDEIEIADLDFDGARAIAVLAIDGHEQERVYRFAGGRWQRTNIEPPDWGEPASTTLDGGVRILYRDEDSAFAEQLAADLPELLALLPAPAEASRLEQISIEPHEFAGALVLDDGKQIVINSPLAQFESSAGEPALAIRLALAEAITDRALASEPPASGLPGGTIVANAARRVIAEHWARGDIPEADLASGRATLADGWLSPFLDYPPASDTFGRQGAAALLLAEYLYQTYGANALAGIVKRLPQANTWDEVFQETLGVLTLAIDAGAKSFAQMGSGDDRPDGHPAPPALPIQVELLTVEPDEAGRLWAYDADTESPLLIELGPLTSLSLEDGAQLPFSCVGPTSTVEIRGEWLDVGLRMRAERLTLRQAKPPQAFDIPAVPDDTIVLLFESPTALMPPSLVALRSDGSMVEIAPEGFAGGIQHALQVSTIASKAGAPLHLLFSPQADACDRNWLLLYNPDRGIVAAWIAPAGQPINSGSVLLSEEEMLFVQGLSGSQASTVFKAGETITSDPIYRSQTPFSFLGWSEAVDSIVVLGISDGQQKIGVIDAASGLVRWLPLASGFTPDFQLSSDGRWLGYLTTLAKPTTRPGVLRALDLTTGEDRELMRARDRMTFDLAPAPHGLPPRQLLLQISRSDPERPIRPRIVSISPDQPDAIQPIIAGKEGETLGLPVYCPDGTLMYQVALANGAFELRVQQPAQIPAVLSKSSRPRWPLACTGTIPPELLMP